MPLLQPGDAAPEFTLQDQDGATVSSADLRGKPVVLFFYPKADTPGCTTQACSLRDAEPDLSQLDAVVIGMSPDKPEKQKRWADKHGIGYRLLADTDHAVAEAFGVWGTKKLYGKEYDGIIRSAFVIDADGKISDAFYKVSPKDTVPKTTKALQALGSKG
jgi:thioredoxin-dependent peroxiredoxin